MDIFEMLGKHEHEQLVFWNEPGLGYKGIIAIHDTTLGPALGGTRFWNYPTEEEALVDALRLSRGMTYKAAVAGLDLGGGKSVIWGDNRVRDREMIFRAHGRAVESLGGRYITAEDVGTSPDDMEYVLSETEHVVGIYGRSGDPSPVTAYGVFSGIKAAAHVRFGTDDLSGRHVAVQGVGHVGYYLCQDLHEAGARLTVTDIDVQRVERVVADFGATAVATDDIYGIDADIFAPCALGAVVNDQTLDVFQVEIIAGGANNQLARAEHAQQAHEKGILYAPDYVANAGGVINVYSELAGWDTTRSLRKADEIYNTVLGVFEIAKADGIPTYRAADRLAERRLRSVGAMVKTWPQWPNK
jgi:leucine dehydrogenase